MFNRIKNFLRKNFRMWSKNNFFVSQKDESDSQNKVLHETLRSSYEWRHL